MSNTYYWEKLTFSKLQFSWKENLKKCTSFEEQKDTRYVRGNVFLALSSSAIFPLQNRVSDCLLFCFAWEMKGFYRSFLENEVDFTDIMNVSSNILAENWNFKKLRDTFVDERAMITVTLISLCHWKTIVTFCLRKKIPENAFLTLTVNYRKIVQKNKLCYSKQQ